MKILKLTDSFLSRVEKLRPLLEIIIFIAGQIGINDKNMITKIGLFILGFIILTSIFSYIRLLSKRNNDLSFIRTYLNGDEWREDKKAIDRKLISDAGSNRKQEIRKAEYLKIAVLGILLNRRNLTYNYTEELINDLIQDENLQDFK